MLKKCLGFWGLNCLLMKIREFSFKFFNNSLNINSRLAHFVQGRGQDCTFCHLSNVLPAQRETFLHLFFYCTSGTKIRTVFENEYLNELPLGTREEQLKFWFFGTPPAPYDSNIFLLTVAQVFMYSTVFGSLRYKKGSQSEFHSKWNFLIVCLK